MGAWQAIAGLTQQQSVNAEGPGLLLADVLLAFGFCSACTESVKGTSIKVAEDDLFLPVNTFSFPASFFIQFIVLFVSSLV